MAHGHDFAFRMVVLKTPKGYLTKAGFTKDVTSPDILSVRACFLGGKWAPKHSRIDRFKEYFDVSIEIKEDECEIFTYTPSDELRKELHKWF